MLPRAAFLQQGGLPSPATIHRLSSPGGPAARTAALQASGWNGSTFVAAPVLRCEQAGSITGTFWQVEGTPAVTWISASGIWPGVPSLQDMGGGPAAPLPLHLHFPGRKLRLPLALQRLPRPQHQAGPR